MTMGFRYLAKIYKFIFFKCSFSISWAITFVKFKLNGVDFFKDFIAGGVPIVNVSLSGKFSVGRNFILNSGKYHNMIGGSQISYFIVGPNAILTIGNNVGISNAALVCQRKITIGNNVRIGGGVVIYDTNFHSLTFSERVNLPEITSNIRRGDVVLEDGCFIGAHSIILKGVSIGMNSIVGAGSVVYKNVPAWQVWAGNPAVFIRHINPTYE
jgi:acetyltransferase-like isoleucine patch superfamily enzyme